VLGVEVWLHAFLILALDVGEWPASRLGCFTSGKELPVAIGYKAGWAPDSVRTRWRVENIPAPARNRTPAVQPVA